MRSIIFKSLFFSLLFSMVAQLSAAELKATIATPDGEMVEHAVVYAVPKGGYRGSKSNKTIVIDQVDKEFVRHVTAIRTGTAVSFPNRDQIRHHVYSFSPTKQFDIPLYKGTPAKPIRFNKPGVVVLGCNIHDWMSAYIFVSDTPHFAVTNKKGIATLKDIPAGNYQVEVWHPRLKGKPEATRKELKLNKGSNPLSMTIKQRRAWSVRRAPTFSGGGYR